MDPNRRFVELARICWHEYDTETLNCIHCKEIMWRKDSKNLDYAADPLAVLRVMVEREDWPEFLHKVGVGYQAGPYDKYKPYISLDLILDNTKPCKLFLAAIEFMEGRKG